VKPKAKCCTANAVASRLKYTEHRPSVALVHMPRLVGVLGGGAHHHDRQLWQRLVGWYHHVVLGLDRDLEFGDVDDELAL
jgi:hypothetical protein